MKFVRYVLCYKILYRRNTSAKRINRSGLKCDERAHARFASIFLKLKTNREHFVRVRLTYGRVLTVSSSSLVTFFEVIRFGFKSFRLAVFSPIF